MRKNAAIIKFCAQIIFEDKFRKKFKYIQFWPKNKKIGDKFGKHFSSVQIVWKISKYIDFGTKTKELENIIFCKIKNIKDYIIGIL